MPKALEEVTKEVMDLPPLQRLALAEFLLQSTDATPEKEIDAAWDSEIHDRIRAIDEGRVTGVAYDDVMNAAQKLAKSLILCSALFLCGTASEVFAQTESTSNAPASTPIPPQTAQAHADADVSKKASDWAQSLHLEDAAKEARVAEVIAAHLKAVRDWHNEHPANTVPAGINPTTGKTLSELDREVIADSAMPKSVHEKFMGGLRKELTGDQVEAVLDKITVGKVAFTLTGYRAIVPNMTREEETYIVTSLEQAREEAVDFKNMNEISAIFKIHKTQIEQYLNANGRNWKVIYKTYVDSVKAKKAGTNSLTTEPTQ